MNTPKFILSGLGAALMLFQVTAFAAPRGAESEAWLNHYYENPQPDRLVPAVFELSRSGFFEQPGHVSLAIGFLGGVFAQNPEQVDQWVMQLSGLPRAHQRLVASALWYSGNAKGADYLRAYSRVVGPEMRAEIEQLLTTRPSLRETEVRSTASLNLQWGAFLATGDAKHVTQVLAALGSDQPGLSAAARFALAEQAVAHERVYQICQDEVARQTDENGARVRTALSGVKPLPAN